MSLWSGSAKEGFWESQIKRPNEEAFTCPTCKQMAKRPAGSGEPFECSNCGTKIAMRASSAGTGEQK